MKPYYEQDGITIYCADWRDVLGEVIADIIVTDPPYGTGGWRRVETGMGSNPAGRLVHEDWDDGATEWVTGHLPVITFWPAARTSRLLSHAESVGLTKHRALYMHKSDPKPQVGGRIAWSVD